MLAYQRSNSNRLNFVGMIRSKRNRHNTNFIAKNKLKRNLE